MLLTVELIGIWVSLPLLLLLRQLLAQCRWQPTADAVPSHRLLLRTDNGAGDAQGAAHSSVGSRSPPGWSSAYASNIAVARAAG